MSYQTTLQSWHDFYAITGQSAAALVGLLFVGLSLHIRVVLSRAEVRALARVTLTNFILILVLALFMVIPDDNSADTGWRVIGLGAVSFLWVAPSLVAGVRSSERIIGLRLLLLRFGSSAVAFLGLVACGVLLVSGNYHDGLVGLVAAVIVVLVVSLRNTWDLLVSVAAAALPKLRETSRRRRPPRNVPGCDHRAARPEGMEDFGGQRTSAAGPVQRADALHRARADPLAGLQRRLPRVLLQLRAARQLPRASAPASCAHGRARDLSGLAPIALGVLVVVVNVFPVTVQRSADQLIFFGGGSATSGVPSWLALPVIFLATAVVMACIGEGVGRSFQLYSPLQAYRLDILGSLAGILAFSALSFLWAPPLAWGAVVAVLFVPPAGPPALARPGRCAGRDARLPRRGDVHAAVQLVAVLQGHRRRTTSANTVKIFVNGVPHQDTADVAPRPQPAQWLPPVAVPGRGPAQPAQRRPGRRRRQRQ